jgi:hypothetical protein
MMIRSSMPLLVLAVLLLAVQSGCEKPTQPDQVTASPVYSEELEPLWDATLSVLQKCEFIPQRQDRAMGIIVSKPTTSRQYGEFWRQDVVPTDSYSMAEANLQTVQRQATVRFVKAQQGWQLEVQVDVFRLSMPESQVTTASSAIQAFSGALPTTEGQMVKARKQWVPLGRDAAMEERLLDRILSTAGQYVPAEAIEADLQE